MRTCINTATSYTVFGYNERNPHKIFKEKTIIDVSIASAFLAAIVGVFIWQLIVAIFAADTVYIVLVGVVFVLFSFVPSTIIGVVIRNYRHTVDIYTDTTMYRTFKNKVISKVAYLDIESFDYNLGNCRIFRKPTEEERRFRPYAMGYCTYIPYTKDDFELVQNLVKEMCFSQSDE